MSLRLKCLTNPGSDLLKEIGRLRVRAYQDTGMSPPIGWIDESGCWLDEFDNQNGTHYFLVYDQDKLVACGRVTVHDHAEDIPSYEWFKGEIEHLPTPIGVPGRMVVEKAYRARGIAHMLCQERINKALELGCASMVVSTIGSAYARTFVQNGFEVFDSVMDPLWDTGKKPIYLLRAQKEELENSRKKTAARDLPAQPVRLNSY